MDVESIKKEEFIVNDFLSVIFHLIWQLIRFDPDDTEICHKLFKSNIYLGGILLLAFVIGKL